jgi:hypothetical protein
MMVTINEKASSLLLLLIRNSVRGEAKEMKKALLCDTLSASVMSHQRKRGEPEYELAVR